MCDTALISREALIARTWLDITVDKARGVHAANGHHCLSGVEFHPVLRRRGSSE
jgi:hypothetical protein